jgi:hypothetical protein
MPNEPVDMMLALCREEYASSEVSDEDVKLILESYGIADRDSCPFELLELLDRISSRNFSNFIVPESKADGGVSASVFIELSDMSVITYFDDGEISRLNLPKSKKAVWVFRESADVQIEFRSLV